MEKFKKEKRENERKKRVEIFARFRVENILLHRQTSILFVLLVCVFVLLFLCFAFVILLNAKNHVVFALVFVAVFFVERGVHGRGSSLLRRRSRRAGEVF